MARTPRAAPQQDNVLSEARNLRNMTMAQTPLLGEENTPVHTDSQGGTGFEEAHHDTRLPLRQTRSRLPYTQAVQMSRRHIVTNASVRHRCARRCATALAPTRATGGCKRDSTATGAFLFNSRSTLPPPSALHPPPPPSALHQPPPSLLAWPPPCKGQLLPASSKRTRGSERIDGGSRWGRLCWMRLRTPLSEYTLCFVYTDLLRHSEATSTYNSSSPRCIRSRRPNATASSSRLPTRRSLGLLVQPESVVSS